MSELTCQNYCLLTRNLWSGWKMSFKDSNLIVCKLPTSTVYILFIYLTRQVSEEHSYLQWRTTLPNLPLILIYIDDTARDTLWYRIEPGSVVTPLALQCIALDRCATLSPKCVKKRCFANSNPVVSGVFRVSREKKISVIIDWVCHI